MHTILLQSYNDGQAKIKSLWFVVWTEEEESLKHSHVAGSQSQVLSSSVRWCTMRKIVGYSAINMAQGGDTPIDAVVRAVTSPGLSENLDSAY